MVRKNTKIQPTRYAKPAPPTAMSAPMTQVYAQTANQGISLTQVLVQLAPMGVLLALRPQSVSPAKTQPTS